MNSIYLDYAAAAPMDKRVIAAMEPFYTEEFYNPSATYLKARETKQKYQQNREKVANILGVRPAEVIFTAGATEANNLAIQGTMRRYPKCEVLTSSIEHESVLAPAELFSHKEIPVDEHGHVKLNKLSNLISDKTVLISVMLVNNELGTIQPLKDIAALVEDARKDRLARGNGLPLYLHTDAAQAGNYLDLHVSRLGVDMMSLNGGKIYGPKQSGVLYLKAGTDIQPLIVGGGQEYGLRSGTENLAAAAGFAAAMEVTQGIRHKESERLTALRAEFEDQITGKIPNSIINGGRGHRAPHLVNLTIPGYDNERLMMELDEAGIQCAVGSACSASRDEPSHVLSAVGLSDELARATLRFSLGRGTTSKDLQKTVHELARLTASNR